MITYEINQEELNNNKNKRRKKSQQVNKSVSFNTIKQFAFELFYLPPDKTQEALDKIYKLLKTNLVAIRPNRKFERKTKKVVIIHNQLRVLII